MKHAVHYITCREDLGNLCTISRNGPDMRARYFVQPASFNYCPFYCATKHSGAQFGESRLCLIDSLCFSSCLFSLMSWMLKIPPPNISCTYLLQSDWFCTYSRRARKLHTGSLGRWCYHPVLWIRGLACKIIHNNYIARNINLFQVPSWCLASSLLLST